MAYDPFNPDFLHFNVLQGIVFGLLHKPLDVMRESKNNHMICDQECSHL